MHINFLFLNQKLSIKYRGDLSGALEYLIFEYGIVRIHSIREKKGPLVIFRNLPSALEVKNWSIKRSVDL
jgi:hypothetical protein